MSDESMPRAAAQAAEAAASGTQMVGRAVKLVGDTMVAPGTSLLLDGRIADGGMHVVAGLVARWALGPVGWLLVAADAYSQSVSGRGLVSHVFSGDR